MPNYVFRNQHVCDVFSYPQHFLELPYAYRTLFSDTSISKLTAMLNDYHQKKSAETNEELNLASYKLEEVTRKIATIVKLVSESGISIDTVKDELKQLENRKHFLEDFISDITLNRNVSMISEDMIFELIKRSKEFVQTKNISECRNFIQSYIEKVIVYAERVEVLFKIHVPDCNTDTASPLKSGESIKILQKDYKEAI